MKMRHFYFDKYHTWHDWRLTLTSKDVTPPEPKTYYIDLDGSHGTLDLSEALTGEVAYGDRVVTASFWTSEGKAADRVALLREISTALHGRKVRIVEPDDPEHFFLGRVTVKAGAHDQVHDEFTLEAVCEPWRYAVAETARRVEVAAGAPVDVVIRNTGVKTLCPDITVDGTVTLTYSGASVELQTGAYKVADIKLRHGANVVSVTGSGVVTFTYREATL
jgi:hypothetical protein